MSRKLPNDAAFGFAMDLAKTWLVSHLQSSMISHDSRVLECIFVPQRQASWTGYVDHSVVALYEDLDSTLTYGSL